jgi:hypothetical protein
MQCITSRTLWKGLKTATQETGNLHCEICRRTWLLAKEKTVLKGMIDRLTENERCYGMEMNVEKN